MSTPISVRGVCPDCLTVNTAAVVPGPSGRLKPKVTIRACRDCGTRVELRQRDEEMPAATRSRVGASGSSSAGAAAQDVRQVGVYVGRAELLVDDDTHVDVQVVLEAFADRPVIGRTGVEVVSWQGVIVAGLEDRPLGGIRAASRQQLRLPDGRTAEVIVRAGCDLVGRDRPPFDLDEGK